MALYMKAYTQMIHVSTVPKRHFFSAIAFFTDLSFSISHRSFRAEKYG